MTSVRRYGNQDLWLPKGFHAEFKDRLVDRGKERVPFPRQVDLWWYALGLGVREGRRTDLPEREQLVKFNDAGILESDPWRITHLELLALSEGGQEKAANPSDVIQIANEFALAGCAMISEDLRGTVDPQMHLLGDVGGGAELSRGT